MGIFVCRFRQRRDTTGPHGSSNNELQPKQAADSEMRYLIGMLKMFFAGSDGGWDVTCEANSQTSQSHSQLVKQVKQAKQALSTSQGLVSWSLLLDGCDLR
jgi:hypothetical protein